MKMKNAICLSVAFFCLLFVTESYAQSIVKDLNISSEEANIQMTDQNLKNYLVEIGGPNAYYWKQQVSDTKEITLGTQKANGDFFDDGTYTLQVTPVYQLTETQRAIIQDLRGQNDLAGIAAFRAENNLPASVDQYVVYFSIRDGKFVTTDNKEVKMPMPSGSSQWHTDHPSLYASVNPVMTNQASRLIEDNTKLAGDDQVFADDVIVDGSLCVGMDCVNGENFGFDTQRIKENNLRIHFDDTSSSASFPGNDWRITINDSDNGGASYFEISDATANTSPLRVMAGAGNNALYISNSGGNVGMGTASPVVELHVADGDSPTMRLEQNGSNGWTPQIWDVAGNETNFFVRDVTNSSKLPFKIRPGAPDNALYVDAEGDIGLGTASPGDNGLQVESGDVYIKAGNIGINTEPSASALDVVGNFKLTGQYIGVMSGTSTFFTSSFQTIMALDATNNRVGIGLSNPAYQLHLNNNDAYKLSGGDWLAASDRRLKKDIVDFTDGLDVLMQIRPVKFHYNGKLGMSSEKEFIGVIAQEMKEVAPYTVEPLKSEAEEAKGKDYLAYDGTAVSYILVNAVQEQQELIDAQKTEIANLQAEVAELRNLKAEVAALAELVKSQKDADATEEAVGEE